MFKLEGLVVLGGVYFIFIFVLLRGGGGICIVVGFKGVNAAKEGCFKMNVTFSGYVFI